MTTQTSNEMLTYNALDCAVTWQCADGFFHEIDDGYQETYDHTIDLYNPLMYMMSRGIRVDHNRLKETRSKIEQKLVEIEKDITERCGRWVNPNSPKEVANYFYVEKGISPYTKYNKKTGKSAVTTDDKALQRIAKGTAARKGYFEAKLMQDYRGLRKLKGTYLDITFDKDNRLRCSYNPRGTRFGRLSSSMTVFGTGMNLQNLPEEFSGFLCADPGNIFIELDLRQAEWIVVAYVSGDASMINAVEQGLDVHAYTASQMFKVPMDVIQFENKILGHSNDPAEVARKRKHIKELEPYLGGWMPRSMSMRQCGKKSNHGLNYDEKYKMFALTNEITEKESKVVIDFYHSTYPGIKSWYQRIQDQLGRDRTLVNLLGRKCRFLDRWGDDLFKAAYSYIPQSTVGEIVNRGMVSIYNAPHEYLKHWEILRQVHDSIHFQTSKIDTKTICGGIWEACNHLSPTLSTGGREFSIGIDCKIGYSLSDMKEIPVTGNNNFETDVRNALNELKATE
jgi:DNA polymerase I-like protein with 3'-5' exonuclease and polymerase domains